MSKIIIPYKKLRANAKAPWKAHDTDAGWDLYVSTIYPHEGDNLITFGCGLAFDFSQVGFADARARSSCWKHGLMLTNGAGVIDADYRGEVSGVFFCFNKSKEIYNIGERFLQLIFPIKQEYFIEFQEVESLSNSDRGEGGYGSTGDK